MNLPTKLIEVLANFNYSVSKPRVYGPNPTLGCGPDMETTAKKSGHVLYIILEMDDKDEYKFVLEIHYKDKNSAFMAHKKKGNDVESLFRTEDVTNFLNKIYSLV